jgi:hypothetical protein
MIDTILNSLFGCRHRRITRPITPVRRPGEAGDTYVACLECGKKFQYDLTTMHVGKAMSLPAASYRPATGPFQAQY